MITLAAVNPLKSIDFTHQMPLIVLVVTGLLLILAEAFSIGKRRSYLMHLSVVGLVLTIIASIWLYKEIGHSGARPILRNMLLASKSSCLFTIFFCVAGIFTVLIAAPHQREHRWVSGEFYGILVFAVAGMAMLAMANDLITLFIGVELMSISVYVLTASRWRSRRGAEAAMKYFINGAVATAFLVYGIALVYGATGSTSLMTIYGLSIQHSSDPVLVIGIFMLIIAFGFKIAAVPFHMWAPDAYEGAPTPVTGFMAAAVKAGAVVAILRLFTYGFGSSSLAIGPMGWGTIFAVLAAITMTIGNLAALRQDSIKRMLAYSSVSHAGVILVGIVAAAYGKDSEAISAVIYYLFAYSATTLGAFAIISWIGSRGKERVALSDWNGLATQKPGQALAMAIFMLSLGGLPPTAGFIAKFSIFKSAMAAPNSELLWLVIVGVLNSAISIYYYLRVVMAMYFRKPEGEFTPLRSAGITFVIVVTALLVLHMGILPGNWIELVASAVGR